MANEASIRSSLQIKTGNIDYRSFPTAFNADVAGAKGPSPGAIAVAITGTDIDLGELTHPSLCALHNIDESNTIEVGIWDGVSYYPMLDLLPGEGYCIRLSAQLTQEYGAVGTGTTGAGINTLRARSRPAAGKLVVEAFEL